MKVAVGSLNPAKIEAATLAFAKLWPSEQWQIEGVKVSSDVSDQPMSDREGIKGAITRATRARDLLNADYGVGLEGTASNIDDYWFDSGWAAVVSRSGIVGLGSSARIPLSAKIIASLEQGQELGSITDQLFSIDESGKKQGYFGLMTNGQITRAHGYRDGLIMALSPFLHPEVFDIQSNPS